MKKIGILIAILILFNGCVMIFQKGRRSDIKKIRTLEQELNDLKRAKETLSKRLAQEIKDKEVKLRMEPRGLVITFVAEVLFDSGKAKLRKDSLPILDKVAKILIEDVPENDIGVEGHTDNQPIKYSKWKSNRELSLHRALSVVEYLEKKGVSPKRLIAMGYGPYRPVASNDTPQGRQLNRRVEIVIMPKAVKKVGKKNILKMGEDKPIEEWTEEDVYRKELK